MPRGGRREGAGRKPGVVNQVTKDIREMAREHAVTALNTLVEIMINGEKTSDRKDAANSLLDRGFGRPGQHIELDADVRQDVLVTAIDLIGKDNK
jgi:hypothetical protein